MKTLIAVILLALQTSVWAAPMDAFEFDSEQQEKSFKKLSDELRCLVCQNQSISGSNADLAKDLRSQVHSMLQAGKTEEEIKDYMVARYGDYVLYEPPMKPMTWVLWFGPAIIFLVGLFYVRRFIAQQNISEEPKKLSEQEAERLRDLQSEMNNKNEGDRS